MPMTKPDALMPNDFRIEKSLLPVTVTLVGGETLVGDVFIQASARHRFELEDAPEVMNAAEPFLPLRLRTGPTLLVAKGQVRDVRVALDHVSHPDWSVAVPAAVSVRLHDGTVVDGKLCIESVSGRMRVLDFLNRATDRFLPVYRADGLVLISFLQVLYIRQIGDAAA